MPVNGRNAPQVQINQQIPQPIKEERVPLFIRQREEAKIQERKERKVMASPSPMMMRNNQKITINNQVPKNIRNEVNFNQLVVRKVEKPKVTFQGLMNKTFQEPAPRSPQNFRPNMSNNKVHQIREQNQKPPHVSIKINSPNIPFQPLSSSFPTQQPQFFNPQPPMKVEENKRIEKFQQNNRLSPAPNVHFGKKPDSVPKQIIASPVKSNFPYFRKHFGENIQSKKQI